METPVCCGQEMVKEQGQVSVPYLPNFANRTTPQEYPRKKHLASFWVCYTCGETHER